MREMHIGLLAQNFFTHYSSYNELTVCRNDHCGLQENKPISVFTVDAADVPRDSFTDGLEEVIPYLRGKSCSKCGTSADIKEAEIGDIIIFDLLTQEDLIALKTIPKYITNALNTSSSPLDLLGMVQSKGSSGRFRSPDSSFAHHTLIVYRPGLDENSSLWFEYDSKNPQSKKGINGSRNVNVQLLVYAKIA